MTLSIEILLPKRRASHQHHQQETGDGMQDEDGMSSVYLVCVHVALTRHMDMGGSGSWLSSQESSRERERETFVTLSYMDPNKSYMD